MLAISSKKPYSKLQRQAPIARGPPWEENVFVSTSLIRILDIAPPHPKQPLNEQLWANKRPRP